MNALDEHLLRAYLDRELDADASEAFEVLMLERPDLAAAVDADTALMMGLAGKQTRQGSVVAVQVKSLPRDAALVEPAGSCRSFETFTHVALGLHGQDQAVFDRFHISRLNRCFFGSVLVGVVVAGGMESGSLSKV